MRMYRKVIKTVEEREEVGPQAIMWAVREAARAANEKNSTGLSVAQLEAAERIIFSSYHKGSRGIIEAARQVLSAVLAGCDGVIDEPPAAKTVVYTLGPVSGFNGLIQVIKAVEEATGVKSATVVAYAQGKARIQVTLERDDFPLATLRSNIDLWQREKNTGAIIIE